MMKCAGLFALLLLSWTDSSPFSDNNQKTTQNINIEDTDNKYKTMKVLEILPGFSNPPLELVTETLDLEIGPLQLEMVNWKEFPYKPDVSVQIAYNENELFLRYQVTENSVKAEIAKSNGRVWTDSCVELFLSPEGNDEYYNLEINCIGTVLLGFRKKGEPAIHATVGQIGAIRRISTLGDSTFPERKAQTDWQITIAVPWKVFFKHTPEQLQGKKMRGNFYKCGDELSVPHFVSWTKIKTEKPNFHSPEFFGALEFE